MKRNMKADDEYKANLEDNFLKHIGYEHVQNLCDHLDDDKDEWNNMDIPDSLDRWFIDFHKQETIRRSKEKNKKERMITILKRASVIILFLIGINLFLYTNVEAYRMKLFDTFIDIKDKFTQIDMVKDSKDYSKDLPKEWNGKYYPTYIPKGYKLTEVESGQFMSNIVYLNEVNSYILYTQYDLQISNQVNSEKGNVTKVSVNSEDGILIENGDKLILNWMYEDKYFSIEATHLPLKQLIKIAESLKVK